MLRFLLLRHFSDIKFPVKLAHHNRIRPVRGIYALAEVSFPFYFDFPVQSLLVHLDRGQLLEQKRVVWNGDGPAPLGSSSF